MRRFHNVICNFISTATFQLSKNTNKMIKEMDIRLIYLSHRYIYDITIQIQTMGLSYAGVLKMAQKVIEGGVVT